MPDRIPDRLTHDDVAAVLRAAASARGWPAWVAGVQGASAAHGALMDHAIANTDPGHDRNLLVEAGSEQLAALTRPTDEFTHTVASIANAYLAGAIESTGGDELDQRPRQTVNTRLEYLLYGCIASDPDAKGYDLLLDAEKFTGGMLANNQSALARATELAAAFAAEQLRA